MTDLSTTISEVQKTVTSEVNEMGDTIQTEITEVKKEVGDAIQTEVTEVRKEIGDNIQTEVTDIKKELGNTVQREVTEVKREVTDAGERVVQTTTSIIRTTGSASQDNPFTSDGELSKKADYILRHSTISRSEVRISDPDLSKLQAGEGEISQTDAIAAESVPLNSTSPPSKENGKLGETVTPQGVQVEVATANASQPQPQTAEQVKVKDKSKCKCCVVQ